MFAAMKLARRDIGEPHVSADIGCHAFATFAPFGFGNSILGYGMSLASNAGVGPIQGIHRSPRFCCGIRVRPFRPA